jgi:NifU-like protein involved in Fe-S cluster formation
MDHFLNPRNAGVLQGDDVGRGESDNPDCGDTAVFTVRLLAGRVAEVRFQSKGCAGAIAACSAATEWLAGKSRDAAAGITPEAIAAALDGMPEAKQGCLQMAVDGTQRALANVG